MQELAILLSSIAGAASAVAIRRFPRDASRLRSMGASPHVKNQIGSLRIEKEILDKTVARLYEGGAGLSEVQRDRLLSRYQHRLGTVLARLEKLEAARRYPDLGPVGDGLITLMDQKLSQLDSRLYELSAKIAAAGPRAVAATEAAVAPAVAKDPEGAKEAVATEVAVVAEAVAQPVVAKDPEAAVAPQPVVAKDPEAVAVVAEAVPQPVVAKDPEAAVAPQPVVAKDPEAVVAAKDPERPGPLKRIQEAFRLGGKGGRQAQKTGSVEVSGTRKHPVEITTLTNIPESAPKYPFEEKPGMRKTVEVHGPEGPAGEKADVPQTGDPLTGELHSVPDPAAKEAPDWGLSGPDEPGGTPKTSGGGVGGPDDDDDDDDGDDLERIKGDIMKTLTKLEQAEVE